jgi:hypothetical protein
LFDRIHTILFLDAAFAKLLPKPFRKAVLPQLAYSPSLLHMRRGAGVLADLPPKAFKTGYLLTLQAENETRRGVELHRRPDLIGLIQPGSEVVSQPELHAAIG